MKKSNCFIFFVIFFSLISITSKSIELGTIYSVKMEIFQDDRVVLKEISAGNGTISAFPSTATGYNIKVLSFDSKELFKENLGVSFIILGDNILYKNSTSLNVRVPFYPTAKYISIYHNNKNIFEIDLSKKICNKNSLCDLGENEYNCHEDCGVETEFPWLYVVISLACVAVLITIFFYKKFGKESDWQKIYKKWQ